MRGIKVIALILMGLVAGAMGFTYIDNGGWFGLVFSAVCFCGAGFVLLKEKN